MLHNLDVAAVVSVDVDRKQLSAVGRILSTSGGNDAKKKKHERWAVLTNYTANTLNTYSRTATDTFETMRSSHISSVGRAQVS